MKIAIILPAWNESLTIGQTVADFAAVLPEAEIWVVDNNSTDKTAAIAKYELAKLKCAGGVLTEKRQGKSNAVRRAFSSLTADIFLLADADSTYSADDAAIIVNIIINDDADMVVGDRQITSGYRTTKTRPLHSLGNMLVTSICNRLYNGTIRDAMSGYRAFSSRFVATYPIVTTGFELEVDLTLHALDKRLRIVEIPTSYRDRPVGSSSKLRTFYDGFKILWSISLIIRYYRPISFFGLFAIIILMISVVLYYYLINTIVMSLFLLSFGFLLSTLFMITGLILDSIAITARRDFQLLWLNLRNG